MKALNKDSQAFLYLSKIFPKISDAKFSAGIFDGPQIRILKKDQDFTKILNMAEINA